MKRRTFITGTALTTAGFTGCLGPNSKFKITDATSNSDSTPFDMTINVIDADATLEGPARVELSITNTSDRPVQVRTRGVWPFGVLQIAQANPFETESTKLARLMSDAYAKSEYVEVDTNSVNVDGTALKKSLSSGEAVAEEYRLSGEQLSSTGEYSIYGMFDPWLFEFSQQDADSWTQFLPKTTINVTSPSLL